MVHGVDETFPRVVEEWLDLPAARREEFRDVVPEVAETILGYGERYGGGKEFDHPGGSPIADAEKKGMLDLLG